MAKIVVNSKERKNEIAELKELLILINELVEDLIRIPEWSERAKIGTNPLLEQNGRTLERIKEIERKNHKIPKDIRSTVGKAVNYSFDEVDLTNIKKAVQFYVTLTEDLRSRSLDKNTEESIRAVYIKRIEEIQREIEDVNAAESYHKYMTAILQWLQYLIGYNKAIQDKKALDSEQQRYNFYFNPVQKIGWEEYPQECGVVRQNGSYKSKLNEKKLKELVNICQEKEKELRNSRESKRNIIRSKNIVCNSCFKKVIEEIKGCSDCRQIDKDNLSHWAKEIERVLNDNEWYFLYYSSEELENQEEGKDNAFREGNSVAVDIPAVFEKNQDGGYELLVGFIGLYTNGAL